MTATEPQLDRNQTAPEPHPKRPQQNRSRPTIAIRRKAKHLYVSGQVSSAAQLAEMLGLSPGTVRDWIWTGQWTKRRETYDKRLDENLSPELTPPLESIPEPQRTLKQRIGDLEIQLYEVEQDMRGNDDPRDLERLSKVHERLFHAWQTLSGTPDPGTKRPEKPAKRAKIRAEVQPIEPAPVPTVQPARPQAVIPLATPCLFDNIQAIE